MSNIIFWGVETDVESFYIVVIPKIILIITNLIIIIHSSFTIKITLHEINFLTTQRIKFYNVVWTNTFFQTLSMLPIVLI